MADYDSIAQARSDANDQILTSRVTGMPPGFAEGFDPTLSTDYQITLTAGTATVFGAEVRISESTQLTDSMFQGTKLGPFWYYIYLSRSGDFYIQRAVPQLDDSLHYYRHPLNEWRAIGRLWVSDGSGTIANEIIYLQKPIETIDPIAIVAPSNSAQKGEAQYVLTGTDDHILLQSALQYLSEAWSGGTLSVLSGTASLGASLVPYKNTRIQGVGQSTVLQPDGDNRAIDASSVTGIEVTGLSIDGSNNTSVSAINLVTCPSAIIRDVVIDSPFQGIAASGTGIDDGPVIDSVVVNSPRSVGVSVGNGARVLNTLIDGEQTAQTTNLTGFAIAGDSTAMNCTVSGLYSSGTIRGFSLSNGASLVVPLVSDLKGSGGNFVRGISCSGTVVNVVGGQVSDLDGATTAGILSSATYLTITSLTITGSTDIQNGAYITGANSSIQNSTITGATGYGILFFGANSGRVIGNTLSGNGVADIGTIADDALIMGNEATSATELEDSGTNNLALGNSWNMTGGELTFPMDVAITGTLDVTGLVSFGSLNAADYWTQADNLVVGSTIDNTGITIVSASSGNGRFAFADTTAGSPGFDSGGSISYAHSTDLMKFRIANSEQIVISSTGVDMAGTLDVTGAITQGSLLPITISNGNVEIKSLAGGGWARHLGFEDDAGNERMEFGVLGNTTSISYGYIGPIYSSASLRVWHGAPTASVDILEDGTINLGKDTDVEVNAARTSLHGSSGAYADDAWFGHYDLRATANSYGLRQNSTGTVTAMNAVTGGDLYFQINQSAVMKMNETGLNIGSSDDPTALLTVRASEPTGDVAIQIKNTATSGVTTSTASLEFFGSALVTAGKIVAGREQDYSTAALRDSFMDFYTTLNGVDTFAARIDSSGNVGIGTVAPAAPLDVAGDGLVLQVGDSSFDDKYIRIRGASGGGYFGLATALNGAAGAYVIQSGASKDISFITNTDTFGASANIRMTIMDTGNVGIGTSTPGTFIGYTYSSQNLLHIAGDLGGRVVIEGSQNAGVDFIDSGGIANQRWVQMSQFSGDFKVRILNDAGTTAVDNALVIDTSNGNVGIGTATPNQELTVEGSISLKEKASANGDTAAYGQWWVKTQTPNIPMFTDDAGNDYELAYKEQLSVANSITVNTGTGSGSVSDIQTAADGTTYSVAEVAGVPGFDVEVGFINVGKVLRVIVGGWYAGLATHQVDIQLYDYTGTAWVSVGGMISTPGLQRYEITIDPLVASRYTSGGAAAIVRIYHSTSGNTSHDLYLDWVALAQSDPI